MTEPTSTSQGVAGQPALSQPPSSQNGPGLGFAVANANGDPVVYIGNDPSLNTLTLTITNQTGAALTLKGGTPVAEEQIDGDGPTGLYLSFGDLLAPDQLKQLHVSAPGWQAAYFSSDVVTNWALTPTADLTVADTDAVVATISHLAVSGSPRPAALTVDYYNVPGVDDDTSQQVLAAQRSPSQPRDLVLDAEIVGSNVVYVSRDPANPIQNTLILALTNSSPDTPIVPPNVPPGEQAPTFTLSFAYGTKRGYGALTTADLGQQIHVDAMDQTEDTWQPDKQAQGSAPHWTLTPQQREILGTGTAGRVAFILSNVVTTFDPETLPTPLYLQWSYIPGYNDGYLSLDLYKALPTPGILSFRALTPEIIEAGKPVLLTWQTFAVARVQLSFTALTRAAGSTTYSVQDIAFDSAAGQIRVSMDHFAPTPIPLVSTTYNLDAYNAHGAKVDSKQIVLTVIDQPVTINSFTVSPAVANFAAGPVDITLSWSVTPPEMVKTLEIEGLADVTGQTSYVVRRATEAATYALRATGLGGEEKIASGSTQALADYLVGRRYQMVNEQISVMVGDESRGYYAWTLDHLEIESPSQARYLVDGIGTVPVTIQPGVTPHRDDSMPSLNGCPHQVHGTWRLVGSTIQVDTSLGTLLFDYQANSEKGEALRFQNPPFAQAGFVRHDFLMTPV
jgi:hypothetical protein